MCTKLPRKEDRKEKPWKTSRRSNSNAKPNAGQEKGKSIKEIPWTTWPAPNPKIALFNYIMQLLKSWEFMISFFIVASHNAFLSWFLQKQYHFLTSCKLLHYFIYLDVLLSFIFRNYITVCKFWFYNKQELRKANYFGSQVFPLPGISSNLWFEVFYLLLAFSISNLVTP